MFLRRLSFIFFCSCMAIGIVQLARFLRVIQSIFFLQVFLFKFLNSNWLCYSATDARWKLCIVHKMHGKWKEQNMICHWYWLNEIVVGRFVDHFHWIKQSVKHHICTFVLVFESNTILFSVKCCFTIGLRCRYHEYVQLWLADLC